MQFLDIDFFLAKEHHSEALAAMKQVDLDLISEYAFIGWNDQDESMSRTLERLQVWNLPKNTQLKQALLQAPSIEVFLRLLDYDVEYDDEDNIIGLEWTGDYWQRYTHACMGRGREACPTRSRSMRSKGNNSDSAI